jgi:sialidase-1
MAVARKIWLVASGVLALTLAATLLVLLAARSLWGDVNRVVGQATGIELPWVWLFNLVTAVLLLYFVARTVGFVRGGTASPQALPGLRTALSYAFVFATWSLFVFVLFTQASDAVLIAEIRHGYEMVFRWGRRAEPPPRDVRSGQRFDEQILFDGVNDPKYVTFRIPGLVVTRGGTVLAYCEARGGYSDWADIDVVAKRSTDGGETWEPRMLLYDGGGGTVNNPLMIAENSSGTVHFLYNVDYARAHYRRSRDGGRTWSPPREITAAFEELRSAYDWRVIAFGPGHGIQLRSGRLLAPVWVSPGGGPDGHHPQHVSTLYSDDGGRTWHAGEMVTPAGSPDHGEPVVAELSDGRVMINMRNEDFRLGHVVRAVSTSPDGAGDWTPVTLDPALPDPISFGAIHAYGGPTLLFANVHNGLEIDWRMTVFGYRGRREPLGIRVSYDDGASWPVAKILQRDEAGYVDLFARDGTIYALFEQGWRRNNHYRTKYLRLARFDLAWVEDIE